MTPESRAAPADPLRRVEPAIADHAIIGDGRSAALVTSDGTIDWLCLPHFSGASLFAAILDAEKGGRFSIKPADRFTARRRYRGATPVLETRFETSTGAVLLTDAMIPGASAHGLEPMREIVRIVEGRQGSVAIDIHFDPRPDYGRAAARPEARGTAWSCHRRDELLLLRCDCALGARDGAIGARIEVAAGQRLVFSLSYEKGDIAILRPLGSAAAERVAATIRWWEEWSGRCRHESRWREAVVRSAVTLKLLTFAMSGAVVAAPTSSLPEWIGAGRNWDYRFCWLRDAALTMRAFTGLGLVDEGAAFLRWLLHATALTQPRLGVVYDLFGRHRLTETELDHLAGHRGSRPVRIGNGAWRQTQLDAYGGVIAAATELVEAGGTLQRDQRRLLAGFGRLVCDLWRQPDHGIWEIRGHKRHYTWSKLMCWVALDRLLALDARIGLDIPTGRFAAERSAIAETIETRGFDTRRAAYVGELDGDWLDSSLLLMPCLGYWPPEQSRLRTTFDRIEAELGHDGLIHRYQPASDGQESPEGAFGLCSFWAIENLARRGKVEQAEARFERMIVRGNDLGLFAEEIDPATGEALGNFPQAFTHVGLINAALAIERARR